VPAKRKYATEEDRKAGAVAVTREWRRANADRMRKLRREAYARQKARMAVDSGYASTRRAKNCKSSAAWLKTAKGKQYKAVADRLHAERVKADPLRLAKARATKAASARARLASDPQARLAKNLRNRIGMAVARLAPKAAKTEELVGCTISRLRVMLESQWKPGMSWANYTTDGWHIDHIRPLASFDLTDPDQQRVAFHYTNLQPLWSADNLRKGSSLGVA